MVDEPSDDAKPVIWRVAPREPALRALDLHLWRVPLAGQPQERLGALLSTDEQAQADRYHRNRDRRRFIVRRAALRLILSRYLCRAPQTLRWRPSADGKPALVEDGNVRFNCSHSDELALIAVACGEEVGIDIERIIAARIDRLVAQRHFAPDELAALEALPPELWPRGFFNGWTRKEAYLKARGVGLALPPESLSVSLTPGQPARLLRVADSGVAEGTWSLYSLAPAPGYVAAAAIAGQGHILTGFQWQVEKA